MANTTNTSNSNIRATTNTAQAPVIVVGLHHKPHTATTHSISLSGPSMDNWDAKSYTTYHTNNSAAHLAPHEMSQVGAPAMPSVPYNQGAYPPQRPPVKPQASTYSNHSGYTETRDKLMKRRVRPSVPRVHCRQFLIVALPGIFSFHSPSAKSSFSRATSLSMSPSPAISSRRTRNQRK